MNNQMTLFALGAKCGRPVGGDQAAASFPRDSPASIARPPMLGEHTESLLGELCGVSPEDVKRMKQQGIV